MGIKLCKIAKKTAKKSLFLTVENYNIIKIFKQNARDILQCFKYFFPCSKT